MTKRFRTSGVLLPIFSLPSAYGIGTLGAEAFRFVDFLRETGCHIWQILPLNVTSYGDSPYQSPSSVGLNYYLIDLKILIDKGLLTEEECGLYDFGQDEKRVSYELLFKNRLSLLHRAYDRFDKDDGDFVSFERKGTYRDFALFMTLKTINGFRPWYEWDDEFSHYSPQLEEKILDEHHDTYLFFIWTQFEFLDQYSALKRYAERSGIRIMGDMPLYLAYDSVEAYKYPDLFLFDENHRPTSVAGCPPDAFTEDGQLWGNPIYDWDTMKKDGFAFFDKRIRYNLELFDILRIDHFRGFSGYYAIPYGAKNARNGAWHKGPGIALFRDKLNLPIVAEDLGFLDDDCRRLLRDTGYPGMKILQFAFDGNEENEHLPRNYKENCFAYTGTHDNMPLLGQLDSLSEKDLDNLITGLKKECDLFGVDYRDSSHEDIVRTLCSLCLASPAEAAILPYQDIAITGAESRINLPSTLSTDNWSYRFTRDQFDSDCKNFLIDNNRRFDR